jgi:hypothetical protein
MPNASHKTASAVEDTLVTHLHQQAPLHCVVWLLKHHHVLEGSFLTPAAATGIAGCSATATPMNALQDHPKNPWVACF